MIDFVVQGTPRSQQAKNKKGWIERVQRAVPSTADLLEGPLRVRIDFFFRGSTDLDTDNIIKPIQDALKEILYDDDQTVVDVCARKINLYRLPTILSVPDKLLRAFEDLSNDFVFVRVAPAHRSLAFT